VLMPIKRLPVAIEVKIRDRTYQETDHDPAYRGFESHPLRSRPLQTKMLRAFSDLPHALPHTILIAVVSCDLARPVQAPLTASAAPDPLPAVRGVIHTTEKSKKPNHAWHCRASKFSGSMGTGPLIEKLVCTESGMRPCGFIAFGSGAEATLELGCRP
jgi:hypothetical protein